MCLSDHRLNVAVNAQLTQAQTVSTPIHLNNWMGIQSIIVKV